MRRKAALEDEVVSIAVQTVFRVVLMKAMLWLWKKLAAGLRWVRRKFKK